jgi:WD40 repeat protein
MRMTPTSFCCALALLTPSAAPTDTAVRLHPPARPVEVAHANYVYGVAFSPDGKALYSACRDGAARIICPVTGAVLATLDGGMARPHALALAPDGKTLAVGDESGAVHFWDVAARKRARVLALRNTSVCALAYAPDGQTLAVGNESRVALVHAADGTFFRKLAFGGLPYSLAFSPDGRRLAACGFGSRDVRLWDAADPDRSWTLAGHDEDVQAVAFSPDGRTLASGGRDGQVILWDAADGKLRQSLTFDAGVTALAFAPNGHWLAVGQADRGTVRVWSLTQNCERAVLSSPSEGGVYALAFSPGSRRLALGAGAFLTLGEVLVWDLGR